MMIPELKRLSILLMAMALAAMLLVSCGGGGGKGDSRLTLDEVSLTPPDAGGMVTLMGDAGALNSGTDITVRNSDLPSSLVVQAESDGSFTAEISAQEGHRIELLIGISTGITLTVPPKSVISDEKRQLITLCVPVGGKTMICGESGVFEQGDKIVAINLRTGQKVKVTAEPGGGFDIELPCLPGDKISLHSYFNETRVFLWYFNVPIGEFVEVEGSVRDEQNESIPGLGVNIIRRGFIVTDEIGEFLYGMPAGGTVEIELIKGQYTIVHARDYIVPENDPKIDIVPEPRPTSDPMELKGLIVSPQGLPLPNVGLVLYHETGWFDITQSGADGRFDFEEPPLGEYRMLAISEGYETRSFTIGDQIVFGEDAVLVLDWAVSGNVVTGVVRDASGNALADAHIGLQTQQQTGLEDPIWEDALVTGADGSFSFAGIDSEKVWLTAEHPGYGPKVEAVEFGTTHSRDVQFVLNTAEEIAPLENWLLEVNVVRENLEPLPGADLVLYDGLTGGETRQVANSEGRTVFTDLRRNSHTLAVRAQGFRARSLSVGPEIRESVQVRLIPEAYDRKGTASLEVTVRDRQGNLLPGVEGFMFIDGYPDRPYVKDSSDTQGRLYFYELADARYELELFNSQFLAASTLLEIGPGEQRVISMVVESVPPEPGTGRVKGFVKNTDLMPVQSALITGINVSTGEFNQTWSGADGYFELDLGYGQILIRISEAGHYPYTHEGLIQLGPEPSLPIEFVIASLTQDLFGSLQGMVTDELGFAVEGAQIILTYGYNDAVWTVETDGFGAYSIDILPVGVYEAEISADRYLPMTKVFDIEEDVAVTLDFDLKHRELADVIGTIFDKQGNPLQGALVRVPQYGRQMITDFSGSYVLPDLPVDPGMELTIECSHEGQLAKESIALAEPRVYTLDFYL